MSTPTELSERKIELWREAAARWEKHAESRQHKYATGESRPEYKLREAARVGAEVINGESQLTSQPSSSDARAAGRPVARITSAPRPNSKGRASGFLIAPRLLMTNHHVFSHAGEAEGQGANFLYERSGGKVLPGKFFKLRPEDFFVADKYLDFAIVALESSGELDELKFLPLIETAGKVDLGSTISIIQYPGGGEKMYAEAENRVVDVLKEGFIHYMTDTLPGSSGSPGFNSHWEVALLHHSGIPKIVNGKIQTKKGFVWQQDMPEDDIEWIANEGIRISAIVQKIREFAGGATGSEAKWYETLLSTVRDPVVSRLSSAREAVAATDPSSTALTSNAVTPNTRAATLFPASMPVVINVNGGGRANFYFNAPPATAVITKTTSNAQRQAAIEFQEKAIEFDENYDNRKGYDPNFLSVEVPIPKISADRQDEIYVRGGKPYVIPYHHFSLVMNKERRLMMWSAVNVDYSDSMRDGLDRDEYGTDKWRLDPRIPESVQIQDEEFYKPATKVDRGHIVRRADNVWGKSARERQFSNSDTFHWTNCTPQHENFNRGMSGGLWGQFEDHIVEQIDDFKNRISIFAGPILAADDPSVDYGDGDLQYPVRFWKIVAGVEKGRLLAFGFILDQSNVIDRLGLETFDPGKFRRQQVQIARIARETGVTFPSVLVAADVLGGSVGDEAIELGLESLEAVKLRTPWMGPIEQYDSNAYGPLLGVSDEGSAGKAIAEAAAASSKGEALLKYALDGATPMTLGVIIDGERMTSSGEVPIGPEEYEEVLKSAEGRTHCSTNVGTRLTARYYQPFPEFSVNDAKGRVEAWVSTVVQVFKPFVNTPDKNPRGLTIRLKVDGGTPGELLKECLLALANARAKGAFAEPRLHRITLRTDVNPEATDKEVNRITELLGLAAEHGVPELVLGGLQKEESQRRFGMQGLLNILDIPTANNLLSTAAKVGVRIGYALEFDTESAARTVWTGLHTAQSYGLNAGKFGLLPLTMEQQRLVVQRVLKWTKDWTAIPAFYVDTPLHTDHHIYSTNDIADGLKLWLEEMKAVGAKVILIDCPDRLDARKLIKSSAPNDRGVLTEDQVASLNQYGKSLGIKMLWSGGISPRQAFRLSKLGVEGIFTTSSTAQRIPVGSVLGPDGQLAAENEPTFDGVCRIHALIQAGFLVGKTNDATIEEAATSLVVALEGGVDPALALNDLNHALVPAWLDYWNNKGGEKPAAEIAYPSRRLPA